jgi:aspartate/tyrosine/aromatic aminotransferase
MSNFFSHVTESPSDPILGLTAAYQADPRPNKVNLSVGIYKTADQKTPVLACVKEAEKILLSEEMTKNYLPIEGDPAFLEKVGELIFGPSLYPTLSKRICSFQSLGGTGGLRIGAEFVRQEIGQAIYISDPSWPNHKGVFSQCGLKVQVYPYYDTVKKEVAFEEMIQFFSSLPPQSLILLHANCHNPSGADLNREQWEALLGLCVKNQLIPFFDAAYLGFDQSIDEDAWAIRLFAERNVEFLLSVSFSKNFSLYAERIGAFFVHVHETSVSNVLSKLKVLIRRNYSNPPLHGAKVITEILNRQPLRKMWEQELLQMRERIGTVRKEFVAALCAKAKRKDYSYLISKKGLFSFCNLTAEQVETLRRDYAIYMTSDGRVNIAGLTPDNLDYVVDAIITVGG